MKNKELKSKLKDILGIEKYKELKNALKDLGAWKSYLRGVKTETEDNLRVVENNSVYSLLTILGDSFYPHLTVEGTNYWLEIYEKLEENHNAKMD